MNFIKENRVRLIFFLLFLINFYLLFPGSMTVDSIRQYNQAVTGNYIYHDPPILAFWWRIMMKVYNSASSMLLFHLALLWGASYNFYQTIKAFDKGYYKWSILYVIIPFLPWIFSFSGMIWKDISLAYGCLFAISLLLRSSFVTEKIKLEQILFILLIIFYGTAAKFLGRYILPVIVLWFILIVRKNQSLKKTLLMALVLSSFIFIGQSSLEKFLIKNEPSSMSWQLVKLYDLAGISVDQNQMLFPEYVINDKNFSANMVKENYNYIDNVNLSTRLYFTKDQKELDDLWIYWFHTVLKHPFSYLKHRLSLYNHLINKSNWDFKVDRQDIVSITVTNYINESLFLTKFKYWILFVPLYILLGTIASFKLQDKRGQGLIFMNTVGALYLLLLIPFNLGSDPRLLYISLVMLTFSHPIAFGCIYDLTTKRVNYKT